MYAHVLLLFVAYVLQDEKQRKKFGKDKKEHPNRGSGKTIYVSADKLVFVDSDKLAKDNGSNAVKKVSDGGVVTRSGAAGRGEHSSVDKPSPTASRRAEGIPKRVASAEPDTLPAGVSRFNVGDRVMMHSRQNVPVHGTVRWTGTLAVSKESKMESPVIFAGIETVSVASDSK